MTSAFWGMHPPKRLSNLAPSKLYFDIPFQTYLSPIVTISGNGLTPLPAVNAESLSHYRSAPPSLLLEIKSCKRCQLPLPPASHRCSQGSTLPLWEHHICVTPSLLSPWASALASIPLHFVARRARGSKAASHQDSFPTIPKPLRLPHCS